MIIDFVLGTYGLKYVQIFFFFLEKIAHSLIPDLLVHQIVTVKTPDLYLLPLSLPMERCVERPFE